jgi:predicted permease
MELITRIAESMLLLLLLFAAALVMRRAGALDEASSRVLARLITLLVLPALVFNHLSRHRIVPEMLEAPAIMLASGILLMGLGWLAGTRLFRLDRPQLGAVVLCTGFCSAAFLGIPLVEIVYPHLALQESVLIAELGVGLPLFLLGPLVAAYYGGGAGFSMRAHLVSYLRSPIFLAIVTGLLWGNLGLPRGGNLALDTLFLTIGHLESALIPLVGLAIGLMLRPMPMARIAPLVAFVGVAQLVLQPLLLAGAARLMELPASQSESLILQAAAPVATLPAIFCREYNCDGELAAGLVLFTTLLSLISIPLVVASLG